MMNKVFFIYEFLKSERGNIDDAEEQAFKKLAKVTFAFSDDELAKLVKTGAYKEVKCHD